MKTYKTSLKMFELKKVQTNFPNVKIGCSQDAANFIGNFYGDDIAIFESAFILLLNNANNTVGYAKISQGGITGTVIDVRLVAKYAVESLATSVMLAHNHPSGTLNPSMADKAITAKVKTALAYFDIKVLDHIILTEGGKYYSMADDGIL